MKPSHKKNVELIKKYPFVSEILNLWLEPYADWSTSPSIEGKRVDDLTIKVEKADGDLLYRPPENLGLGESSFCFVYKGRRKGQIMKQGEYLFAISHEDKMINQVHWPRNEEQARGKVPIHGWSVFWATRLANDHFTDCIVKKVKYLLWITVQAWYEHNVGNADDPFGKFIDRVLIITVYEEPEEGFEKLKENANVFDNLFLNSKVFIRGAIQHDHDIISIGGMLAELCIFFQDEVYFNGMKKILDEGKFRGASGTFGPAKVLAAEMCGYDRVTLEDPVCWITFQMRPGASGMYVLGMGGTLPQIRNLVKTVVRLWNSKPEAREAFKPDGKVSVI